jgi:hypothetical protein
MHGPLHELLVPGVAPYEPAEHSEHAVAPHVEVYEPREQLVQFSRDETMNVDGAHTVQAVLPGEEATEPVTHAVHEGVPASSMA